MPVQYLELVFKLVFKLVFMLISKLVFKLVFRYQKMQSIMVFLSFFLSSFLSRLFLFGHKFSDDVLHVPCQLAHGGGDAIFFGPFVQRD